MKRTTRTGSPTLRLLAIFLFALITLSCASAAHKEEETRQSLKVAVEAFDGDIRWQDFQSAAAFVPKGQKERYWTEMDAMKEEIRLTDFELRDIEYSDHDQSARVIVHFQYWRMDSPILKSVILTQTWRYQCELKKTKEHKARKAMWQVSDTGFKSLTGVSAGF